MEESHDVECAGPSVHRLRVESGGGHEVADVPHQPAQRTTQRAATALSRLECQSLPDLEDCKVLSSLGSSVVWAASAAWGCRGFQLETLCSWPTWNEEVTRRGLPPADVTLPWCRAVQKVSTQVEHRLNQ